jgi:arginyl-tRNA synthetase
MDITIALAVKELFAIEARPVFTRPDPKFGDYATNIALQIAGKLGKNPREVATAIADQIKTTGDFQEVSVAGPGFINLRVAGGYLADVLKRDWNDSFGETTEVKIWPRRIVLGIFVLATRGGRPRN